MELRTGIGARVFARDREAVRAGVDLFYGIDGYFARRGVVRIDLHAGTLGSALAAQARATLGMMIARVELYAGYDHSVFVGRGRATLGGPIAGVRAWF